jgi:hypothetical protein
MSSSRGCSSVKFKRAFQCQYSTYIQASRSRGAWSFKRQVRAYIQASSSRGRSSNRFTRAIRHSSVKFGRTYEHRRPYSLTPAVHGGEGYSSQRCNGGSEGVKEPRRYRGGRLLVPWKALEKTTLLEGIQSRQRILGRIRGKTKGRLKRIWQQCTRRDRETTNCSKRLGRSSPGRLP